MSARRGWGWPALSKKAHFFEGMGSLCRKWIYGGELETDVKVTLKRGPDDCAICHRVLVKTGAPR